MLTENEISRINKESRDKTFDRQTRPGTTVEDLDMVAFTRVYLPAAIDATTLAENGRSEKEQLSSLGFFDPIREQCTYSGILLFGKNPRRLLPGAYVQYVKFDSTQRDADFLAGEKEFSGDLVQLLKNIQDFIDINIIKQRSVPESPQSFRERMVYNYPSWAIRELAMNAIMHRDYQSNAPVYIYEYTDRIEIVNPGGLYGDARPENFPTTSDYRNPILAAAMKNLGYVNRFNYGIKTAQIRLQQNGNPQAAFDLSLLTKFFVTVRINPEWKK